MTQLVTPNPNRRHPHHCPYCAGMGLSPHEADDFAWHCDDCLRIFTVAYLGQTPTTSQPAPSTHQALVATLPPTLTAHTP